MLCCWFDLSPPEILRICGILVFQATKTLLFSPTAFENGDLGRYLLFYFSFYFSLLFIFLLGGGARSKASPLPPGHIPVVNAFEDRRHVPKKPVWEPLLHCVRKSQTIKARKIDPKAKGDGLGDAPARQLVTIVPPETSYTDMLRAGPDDFPLASYLSPSHCSPGLADDPGGGTHPIALPPSSSIAPVPSLLLARATAWTPPPPVVFLHPFAGVT